MIVTLNVTYETGFWLLVAVLGLLLCWYSFMHKVTDDGKNDGWGFVGIAGLGAAVICIGLTVLSLHVTTS